MGGDPIPTRKLVSSPNVVDMIILSRPCKLSKFIKGSKMTRRDDFVKTYGRSPTEAELKAFVKMIELIKSERLKFGIPLR